jgi:hypothetical protein
VSTWEDQQRILSEIERDLRRGNRMSLLRARDVLRRKSVGVLLGVEAVLVIAAVPLIALYLRVRLGRSGRNRPGAPWSPWRL